MQGGWESKRIGRRVYNEIWIIKHTQTELRPFIFSSSRRGFYTVGVEQLGRCTLGVWALLFTRSAGRANILRAHNATTRITTVCIDISFRTYIPLALTLCRMQPSN